MEITAAEILVVSQKGRIVWYVGVLDAMLLSYAWQNDFCFPGQRKLGVDMGLHETNVRKHLKALETNGLLVHHTVGQGRTNI